MDNADASGDLSASVQVMPTSPVLTFLSFVPVEHRVWCAFGGLNDAPATWMTLAPRLANHPPQPRQVDGIELFAIL